MLDTVFYLLLNMSLASCFVIAALLLVRQIKPLPRRVVYPLLILAFFRLVMPFSFPTSWSLFNFTGGLVKRLVTVESFSQDSGMWAGVKVRIVNVLNFRRMTLIGALASSAFLLVVTIVLITNPQLQG